MRHHIFILLALAFPAVLGCGCSKQPGPAGEGVGSAIVFRADGIPAYAEVTTKATAVTTATLSSFYAAATTGSAGNESSAWTSYQFNGTPGGVFSGAAPGKWWPLADPGYHFYASNLPLTFAAAGTTVAATSATDVVCAYLPNPTFAEPNTLTFSHVFARLGDVTVNAQAGYTLSAVSISITPKTGGTYNLRTGAGQTDGTGWSAPTTGSATGIALATAGTKSNDIYLVPGTYTLTATWTATRGDYTETFASKQVSVFLMGGKVNDITTTLGGLAEEIVFTVSVTEWSNRNVEASFPTP